VRRGAFLAAILVLSATVVIGIGLALAGEEALDDSGNATRGEAVPYTLRTHCGILSAFFAGRLWIARPPLSDGSGNPPRGWGNPSAHGTMRFVSDREAEFRSDSGRVAHFVPARPGQRDPAAGCE
jgi:hypothetical protein